MPRTFVGIGSNIHRERSIRAGIRALRNRFGELLISEVYESPAYGFDGDNFYNLVVAFDTELSPEALIRELHHIEDELGRDRNTPRFSPRLLDLDLLLYGNTVRHDDKLDIPREDIYKYAFVLRPLSGIAGQMKHPETGETFDKLWQSFTGTGQELRPVQLTFDD